MNPFDYPWIKNEPKIDLDDPELNINKSFDDILKDEIKENKELLSKIEEAINVLDSISGDLSYGRKTMHKAINKLKVNAYTLNYSIKEKEENLKENHKE